MNKNQSRPQDSSLPGVPASQRPFSRINYLLMALCLLLIVAGFLLMTGPGSSPETGFNPDIFSTRRIVIGPTVTFLGFLLMAFAIVWNPARTKKNHGESRPGA